MVNDIIKHVRTKMTAPEKEKLTTELLKGYTKDGWVSDVIQTVWKNSPRRNTQKLQRIKSIAFDLLVAKYENEGNI